MHGCVLELALIKRVPSHLRSWARAIFSGVCRAPELALWHQALMAYGCRHVHAYERHNRVFNYTVDDCAPYHVTIGMPQEQSLEVCTPQSCCILTPSSSFALSACPAHAPRQYCPSPNEGYFGMECNHRNLCGMCWSIGW